MATVTRYIDVDAAAGGDGTTTSLSGGTCAYKSLSIWEAARQADIATAGNIEKAVCQSTHANHTADTTAVTIDGWTTSDTCYIWITVASGSRHAGVWSTSKYRLTPSAGYTGIIACNEGYVLIDGIQGYNAYTGSGQSYFIYSVSSPVGWIKVLNCIYSGAGNTGVKVGFNFNPVVEGFSLYVENCLLYDLTGYCLYTRAASAVAYSVYVWSSTLISTCTASGYEKAVRTERVNGTLSRKNNIVIITSGTCFSNESAGAGITYDDAKNISSDATAPGTGSLTNQVGTDLMTDPGNDDYTLKSGSNAINAGADLSAVMDAVDITGASRSGTWDIGAFEYVSAVTLAFPPLFAKNQNTLLRR